MPEILALIPAILPAALGTATSIYSMANAPSAPKLTAVAPTPQTTAQNEAQRAAVSSTLPTLQALTGGSLSPEYASQYGATQSGLGNTPQAAGNIQAAINAFFGLTAPGTTGLTPSATTTGGGSTSTIDMLNRATGSRGPTTGGGGSLVDSMLSSDEFKGLAA